MLRDNDEKKASDLKEEGIPSSASEIARAPRLPSELDGINISKALSFITEEKLPQSKTTVGLTDSAIAFYAISLKYQRGMELIKQYINDEKIKQNFSFELDEVISDWNNFIKRYLPLDFRKNLLNKVLDENKSSTDTQVSEIKKSATDEVEINEPQIEEKNPFIRAANKVKNKNIDNEKLFAKTTRKLELMFAKIVFTNLNKKFHHIDFSHAHKQVTMASDIAILLEKHAMIHSHYDIEKEEKKPISSTAVALSIEPSGEHKGEEKKLDKTKVITVTEDTTLLHLRPNLYDKYLNFETEPGQKWLRSTLKFAGFDANAKGTWIENLFRDPKTQAKLKEAGVPATSSSRWLFLPGNARTHEIKITVDDHVRELSVIAIGTLTPFDVAKKPLSQVMHESKTPLQEQIALDELKEIFSNKGVNLEARRKNYEELYGDLKEQNFYFNYQTLLSPILGESNLSRVHKDNNENFVNMTKKTMQSMADEKKGDSSLKFLHTNSAVNKLASFAEEFSEDIINREEKIQSTVRLLERINDKGESKHTALSTLAHHLQISDGALDVLDKKGTILKDALLAIKYSKDLKEPLKDEIILRIQATYALRRVLNPKDTGFNHLSEYQRNIMIAALELLCQGKQALNLVGCKSARDRTAIVLSAAKTMLETPRAMQHWHVLNLGIIDSLKRGHHARAMQHHCEMIKVGDVHSDFDAQLDKATKIKNKSRKPFSKTLKEETSWKKTALKFLVAGGIATTLVLFPPLGLGLVGASLVGAISASGIGLGIAFGVPAIVSRFQNSILWQTIKQNKWKILGATLGIGIAATTFGLGFIPLGLAFLASPFLAYAGAKVAAKIEHKVSPGEDLPNEEKERILESDIGSANIPPYDEFTPPVTPSRTLRAEPEATTPSRKGSAYFEQKSTSGVSTPTSENTPQPKK